MPPYCTVIALGILGRWPVLDIHLELLAFILTPCEPCKLHYLVVTPYIMGSCLTCAISYLIVTKGIYVWRRDEALFQFSDAKVSWYVLYASCINYWSSAQGLIKSDPKEYIRIKKKERKKTANGCVNAEKTLGKKAFSAIRKKIFLLSNSTNWGSVRKIS